MIQKNDNLIKKFILKLQNEGKSKVSVKNYKSDINHFLAWAVLKLKTFGSYASSVTEICPFLSKDFFNEYKSYLVQNKVKYKTINRRLSTLRNFSSFLYSTHLIDEDFMAGIQNVGIGKASNMQEKTRDIVDGFRKSLTEDNKISSNTVKNYVADVRSFLTWMSVDSKLEKGDLPSAN